MRCEGDAGHSRFAAITGSLPNLFTWQAVTSVATHTLHSMN